MRIITICLFLTACAHGVADPSTDERLGAYDESLFPDSGSVDSGQEHDASKILDAGLKNKDGCVPRRFAADSVPYGFVLDPNCPPNIYYPPKWIPPWDYSPVESVR